MEAAKDRGQERAMQLKGCFRKHRDSQSEAAETQRAQRVHVPA